jgi:hypothetical protein
MMGTRLPSLPESGVILAQVVPQHRRVGLAGDRAHVGNVAIAAAMRASPSLHRRSRSRRRLSLCLSPPPPQTPAAARATSAPACGHGPMRGTPAPPTASMPSGVERSSLLSSPAAHCLSAASAGGLHARAHPFSLTWLPPLLHSPRFTGLPALAPRSWRRPPSRLRPLLPAIRRQPPQARGFPRLMW